jgi:hypothetical protein
LKEYAKSQKRMKRPTVLIAQFTKAIGAIKPAIRDAMCTYEKKANDV